MAGRDGLSGDRRRLVLRQSLSVGVATGAYGVSFGALSVAAGLSLWQTMALSALLFSGGSQFALVGIVAAGGTGAAAVLTSSLLGVRNGLYGLQVSRLLAVRGWRRPAAAQLTIDESTAVAIGQRDPRASRFGFWATGLAVFVLWNVMTLVGGIIGDLLGDPKRWGLDAAAAGAFLALLWPRLRAREAQAVGVAAALAALLVAPHAAAGIPVLVAALAAVGVGLWPARRTGRGDPVPPMGAEEPRPGDGDGLRPGGDGDGLGPAGGDGVPGEGNP